MYSEMSTTSGRSTRCHLLELPAELRLKIHELVLTEDEGPVIQYRLGSSYSSHRLALAATCKQIYEETKDLFTTLNKDFTFNFAVAKAVNNAQQWESKVIHDLIMSFTDVVEECGILGKLGSVHLQIGDEPLTWDVLDDRESLLLIGDAIGGLVRAEVRTRVSFEFLIDEHLIVPYDLWVIDKSHASDDLNQCLDSYAYVSSIPNYNPEPEHEEIKELVMDTLLKWLPVGAIYQPSRFLLSATICSSK